MQSPKEILHKYWGHADFRGSQEKIIQTLINGTDCLALMPTGGGKSLCFQIPALARPGLCIVVSPLVALIQNQVDSLKSIGIKAIALTGGISFDELSNLLDNCLYGAYKFLYLSPERLQQTLVQQRLQEMNINLLVIDEAHCISQWGHDFRPAYRNCTILRELHPKVPLVALTATATKKTTVDIVENLQLRHPIVFKDSFTRQNLIFSVKETQDKRYALLHSLKKDDSAIVYVRTRKNTKVLHEFLREHGLHADFFHGGLTQEDKKQKLHNWLSGKNQIMVATNAFGMGIDKEDVRNVIHFQLPDSIENYFQEIGRAGRDGKRAQVTLLTNKTDAAGVKKQFLDALPDVAFIKKLYHKLNTYFQIPYGEGNSQQYDFQFNVFCKRYNFNNRKTFNGLTLLDQNSIISLSEAFHKKSTIRFLGAKGALFNYLEENPSIKTLVQTILRTYGGVFDFDTNINPKLISKKTNLGEKDIHRAFKRLKKDGIIEYMLNKSDLTITFLVPREDEKTINRFASKVELINNGKKERLQLMLKYVENDTICRSTFLLNYFGENPSQNCGECDICLSTKNSGPHFLEDIKEKILEALRKKEHSSRALALKFNYEEKLLLKAIQELLEDEYITLNVNNAYQIRTSK